MQTATTTRTLTILAHRKAEAAHELGKLARKASKYGGEPVSFQFGPTRTETREYQDWDGGTRRCKVDVCDVTVIGSAPRVGNYEFLARIEHTDAGNMLQTVPGNSVAVDPRYRTSTPLCEHCQTRRRRNDTFIVLHRDTGEQRQIGKNCLRDYLGIDPAAAIAKCAFEFKLSGDEWGDEFGVGGWHWSQTLEFLLTATATSIRIDGWLSRSEAAKRDNDHKATATLVSTLWSRSKDRSIVETRKRLVEKMRPEDAELARNVIAWVRSDGLQVNNDYIHNLKVVCAKDVIHDARHVGLVCSAVAAYNRAQEIETRRRAELQSRQGSKHVGAKGERLRGIKATLLSARGLGENAYGLHSVLYKFLTIEGNVMTWITTADVEIAAGRAVLIDGTVKDHREWQGIAETRLSRAKVTEVEDGDHRKQAA